MDDLTVWGLWLLLYCAEESQEVLEYKALGSIGPEFEPGSTAYYKWDQGQVASSPLRACAEVHPRLNLG